VCGVKRVNIKTTTLYQLQHRGQRNRYELREIDHAEMKVSLFTHSFTHVGPNRFDSLSSVDCKSQWGTKVSSSKKEKKHIKNKQTSG